MTYRGDLEVKDIFMAICSGFSQRPPICKKENFNEIANNKRKRRGQRSNASRDHVNFTHVGVAVFIVMSFNLTALFLYRYFHKKKLRSQLNQQVNSAVS